MAGALGPTSKTASISGSVNDPAARGVTYDQLVEAYYEQARGLLEGGADLLLVETVFDSLNSKAALFAIARLFEELAIDASGGRAAPSRVPVHAFVYHHRSERPHAFRANGGGLLEFRFAFSAFEHRDQLRAGAEGNEAVHRRAFRLAPIYVSAYPNAGLPNPMLPTGFPETPETLAPQLADWAAAGWLNIVGGCCGTTAAAHQGHRAGGKKIRAPRAARRSNLFCA